MQFTFLLTLVLPYSAVLAADLTTNTTATFLGNFQDLVHGRVERVITTLTNLSPAGSRADVQGFLTRSFSEFESQIMNGVAPVATDDIAAATKDKAELDRADYAQLASTLSKSISPKVAQIVSKWTSAKGEEVMKSIREKMMAPLDKVVQKLEEIKQNAKSEQAQEESTSIQVRQRRSLLTVVSVLGGTLLALMVYTVAAFMYCLIGDIANGAPRSGKF